MVEQTVMYALKAPAAEGEMKVKLIDGHALSRVWRLPRKLAPALDALGGAPYYGKEWQTFTLMLCRQNL